MAVTTRDNVLVLFDIDGTLTLPRQGVERAMLERLDRLKEVATVGVVGGSDLEKGKEQLGEDILQRFDYYFPQNGLQGYRDGRLIHDQSLVRFLGEDKLQRVINCALLYMAGLELPKKRGNFVECRSGMLNLCPVGRSCSQAERDEFVEYDREHGVRSKMVAHLQSQLADLDLCFVIGGQISIDVFPRGWDKTYCLQHVADRHFARIYYFGDKTAPGENDHEIFESPLTIGHAVTGPQHTIELLNSLF
ncbi:MAG: HAD-IIB family hydrolase [archaeon]|nr:HAD-IIB family hydrolase [archaeon]